MLSTILQRMLHVLWEKAINTFIVSKSTSPAFNLYIITINEMKQKYSLFKMFAESLDHYKSTNMLPTF